MLLPDSDAYNYHSHTQFCDGRADMTTMAEAACNAGMKIWGFSPHSPICVDSPCNMSWEDIPQYFEQSEKIADSYAGHMKVLSGMEIDYISKDFGPHIDKFQNLPLHYRIGSVHFVPNQDGFPIDCDGSYERFKTNLSRFYNNDLRYIVEKFFEQELMMIESGGFDILGHFDKIAANASLSQSDIEETSWYRALIADVISHAKWNNLIIEINTKSFVDKNRFFPAQASWKDLIDEKNGESIDNTLNTKILINSDAHYPDKVNSGRDEAFHILRNLGTEKSLCQPT